MWNSLEHLEARFGGGGAVGAGGLPTPTGGKLVELPVSYLGVIIVTMATITGVTKSMITAIMTIITLVTITRSALPGWG